MSKGFLDDEYCITYALNGSIVQGVCSTNKDKLEHTANKLTQTYQRHYWVSKRNLVR